MKIIFSEFGIIDDGDNASVILAFTMQSDEISTVEREHSATFFCGKSQNFVVGNTLIGPIGGLNGEDIVTKFLETAGGAIGKLFVSVEFCHRLSCLVFLDGLGDFCRMGSGVCPSVC